MPPVCKRVRPGPGGAPVRPGRDYCGGPSLRVELVEARRYGTDWNAHGHEGGQGNEMTGRPRYIAIEGPIGVGKTSLARLLAKELSARLVLEDVEANPFLIHFYSDRRKFAFQTQVAFLVSRFIQQRDLAQEDLFHRATVSDYFFPKDRVFAGITLDENEFALYDKIYRLFNPRIPKPDLVIYLHAPSEFLLARILKRGKEYEKAVGIGYLDGVVRAYNEFFFHYAESPLLVVETSNIDFVENPRDFSDLMREIKRVKSGVMHYLPR